MDLGIGGKPWGDDIETYDFILNNLNFIYVSGARTSRDLLVKRGNSNKSSLRNWYDFPSKHSINVESQIFNTCKRTNAMVVDFLTGLKSFCLHNSMSFMTSSESLDWIRTTMSSANKILSVDLLGNPVYTRNVALCQKRSLAGLKEQNVEVKWYSYCKESSIDTMWMHFSNWLYLLFLAPVISPWHTLYQKLYDV